MVIGFLVPHRCEHPALGHCTRCGRSFCEEHVQVTPQGLVCVACQQGLAQPVALPITAQTFTQSDIATFAAASMWDQEGDLFSDLS
jgi:recombinational DNA repair protein (RecF pathway)